MIWVLFTRLIIRLFQLEQCFSLPTNQPTVFFSRLINAAERSHVLQLLFKDQGLDELVLQDIKPQREVPETETPFWT
jgi:hypothetical protein